MFSLRLITSIGVCLWLLVILPYFFQINGSFEKAEHLETQTHHHRTEDSPDSIPIQHNLEPTLTSFHKVNSIEHDTPPFVPTNDWQEILPHQMVPPGLDYRIDLSTEKTFARLLPKDNQTNSLPLALKEDHKSTEEDKSTEETANKGKDKKIDKHHVLGNLPSPPEDFVSAEQRLTKHEITEEEFKLIVDKIWKRRQADLKAAEEAMKDPWKALKVHTEMLKSLREMIAAKSSLDAEQLSTFKVSLLNLQSEVEDIDNARDFVMKLDGSKLLIDISKAFSELSIEQSFISNNDVQDLWSNTLWTLGTSIKHIQKNQYQAIEHQAIEILLDSINKLAKESQWKICSKAVYALSAVLENMPDEVTQHHFKHGPEILMDTLAQANKATLEVANANREPQSARVRDKVIQLFTDLNLTQVDLNRVCELLLHSFGDATTKDAHHEMMSLASTEKVFRLLNRVEKVKGYQCPKEMKLNFKSTPIAQLISKSNDEFEKELLDEAMRLELL